VGYPVKIEVHYRFWAGSRLLNTGMGRTVDISNSVILFESEDALPLGRRINLTIPWPARGNPEVRLALHVLGRTVRGLGNRTTVEIIRCGFRARASRTQTDRATDPLQPERRCSTAQLVYCSAENWARDGTLSDAETVVQGVCTVGEVVIDLQIEPAFEAAEMALVGQVVNRQSGEPLAGAPVRLLARKKLLATTRTNSCGEFCLVSSLQSGMKSILEIEAAGLRVRIPLDKPTARFRI
jgi:hypothetical protein